MLTQQKNNLKTTESKYCKCLYFTSSALARKVEKLAQQSWKKIGLAPSHAYLLMMVIERPGMQPGQIGDELQLTPSTITRLMEKLEERKLVVRIAEGKQTNVYPTAAGNNLYPDMKKCAQEFQQSYSAMLGEKESSRLVMNMGRMADML